MNENRYKRTVDSIHAPEGAVQNMLNTVRNHEKEKRTKMKAIGHYILAASIAAAIVIGGIIGFNALRKDNNHQFRFSANAAELTAKEFTPICTLNSVGGESSVNRETGVVTLKKSFQIKVSVDGENVTNVTFAGKNVAIEEVKEDDVAAAIGSCLLGLGITADSADETLPAEVRQAILDWNDYLNTKVEEPVVQPGFDAASFNQNEACTAIYTALLDRLTVTVTVTFSDGQTAVRDVVFQCDGVNPETGLMTISAKLK